MFCVAFGNDHCLCFATKEQHDRWIAFVLERDE